MTLLLKCMRLPAVVALLLMAQADTLTLGGTVPVSIQPPGGLAPSEVPQMIVITFDDAVNESLYPHLQQISNHSNPDGSPVSFTFFISTDWTDYRLVHQLHASGHEIAVHTMTHTTGAETDFDTWIREIEGCREALHRYAAIPRKDLRGFRSPFLAYNPATFEALSALGFEYESSLPEKVGNLSADGANFIWPYTLQDGIKQVPNTGTPPEKPYPDLMTVPMWDSVPIGASPLTDVMDPQGEYNELLAEFKENFTQRYEGNRAPWGLWLHAAPWFGTVDPAERAERVDLLNEFLEWALEKPDVWVVGMGDMADWVRHPTVASDPATANILHTETYTPIPASQHVAAGFGDRYVHSVQHKPPAYPSPSDVFQRLITVGGVEVELELTESWSTGYQGVMVVSNTNDYPLAGWVLRLPHGGNQITWGDGARTAKETYYEMRPQWSPAVAEIAAGGTMRISFGGSGSWENFGAPSGQFFTTGFEKPEFRRTQMNAEGKLELEWTRTAPIYELQHRESLKEGSWTTLHRIYGSEATKVEPTAESGFYRMLPIH